MNRWNVLAAALLLAVAALHYTSIPRTIWEYDESLFVMGVERFEPLLHHPPPPGYPLYMAFAKIVALFTDTPFRALLVTSILAVAAGLVAFTFAFREISGSFVVGALGAALLYASPAVLMSGTLPQSDAGALALFGLAIWACARGNPIAAALACAAVIGWRLQFSIAVVPMFLTAVVLMRTWRNRLIAVATFGVACLAWFVPLVIAAGGPQSYWKWLSGQAAYYAAHDSDLSRSGLSTAQIGLRFIAHPWGTKWLAIPVLLMGVWGVWGTYRTNRTDRTDRTDRTLLVAVGGVVYLAFAVLTMDPADAVRYAIPALPLVAFLAARAWRIALVVIPLYAAGAYWYASPVLRARTTTDAPPTAAAEWIAQNVPRNTILMADAVLRPQAGYLLRGWKTEGDIATPMVILADGERQNEPGTTFRWPDTDAYRKLTRQHYGAVSVILVSPSRRFRVIEGVSAPERTRDGKAWRWIGARGTIELPDLGATRARLVFRIPPEYPFDWNRVHVSAGGRAATVTLRREQTAEIIIDLPAGGPRITFTPERSFVPAEIPGANNRDKRRLSVMLTRVEQLDPRPTAE